MRILQVSSAQELGGGETHVLGLVDALRKSGHEVFIAGRKHGPLHPDFELPFWNSADFGTAYRLRQRVRHGGFDILHAHVARDYTIAAAAVWGLSSVGLVCTRHLLYRVRPNPIYRRVDGWIAPTSQISASLEALRPKLSTVIPNWVDLQRFHYRAKELSDPVSLGLLGEIAPHKGHDDAIEAMRVLGSGFRLFIAGTGPTKYVEELKKKASGIQVQLCGFMPAARFFELIDVLIVPSWEEPFGIVLLEAMASGVPVIATDRGGPVEIIQSELHGVLVPPRNGAAIAKAVRSLALDTERRQRMSRCAREHVENNFAIRHVVPKVEEFYRRVMRS
jgi:glycosyltransferase involved in cell wall biosynthesis